MAQDLSEDILYPIFLHVLPSVISISSIDFHNDVRLQRLSPLNFFFVCRSWRSVCMARPSLWSSIHCRRLHQGHFPLINSLLKYWFFRGASAPLDIKLEIVDEFFLGDPKDNLLDLVVGESHRWNEIQIIVNPEAWREAANPPTLLCPASTKTLKIQLSYESLRELKVGQLDLSPCTVDAASQLRVLQVDSDVRWVIPAGESSLFLPNLQYLKFTTDCNIGIDVILAACPNIWTLDIEITNNIGPTQMKSVVLPHLTDLFIRTRVDDVTNRLLNHLSCPSLLGFKLSNCWEVTPLSLRSIAKFLSVSNPARSHLRRLFLYYMERRLVRVGPPDVDTLALHSEHAAALKEILDPLDNLTILHLHGVVINEEIIEFLSPQPGNSTSVCPSLNSISMLYKGARDVLNEALEEMIVSRWRTRKGAFFIDLLMGDIGAFARNSRRIQKCISEGLMAKFL